MAATTRCIDVTTQAELDAALKEKDACIHLKGNGFFEVSKAYGSAQVTAYGSAQVTATGSAQVRAYDSAQVTATGSAQVRAYDSAQVRATDSAQVTAYGSAQVTATGSAQVRAYDSAQVTAYDSAQVTAYDSAQVRATKFVAVTKHGARVKVIGGTVIEIPRLTTPELWCEFFSIEVSDGVAILYKAVGDNYVSPRGTSYAPGTIPVAPDWDGGREECGGGLHFSPRPYMALKFNDGAKKFVGCPVALKDIAVHPDGDYPDKCKARGCCGPCFEVTIDGERVVAPESPAVADDPFSDDTPETPEQIEAALVETFGPEAGK